MALQEQNTARQKYNRKAHERISTGKIKRDEPNAETKKAIEDVERGIGLSRKFSSVDELLEDLLKDA